MGFNVDSQVAHWWGSADEDIAFAEETLERGKIRYALFFTHLALEKALKALVCKVTKETPPKIHNLVSLAELAGIKLVDDQKEFLNQMTGWSMSGRYTDSTPVEPPLEGAIILFRTSQEFYRSLTNQ